MVSIQTKDCTSNPTACTRETDEKPFQASDTDKRGLSFALNPRLSMFIGGHRFGRLFHQSHTRACRIENHLDAWRSARTNQLMKPNTKPPVCIHPEHGRYSSGNSTPVVDTCNVGRS